MRRLLSTLATVSLLAAQQAHAELDCLRPQERSVVEVAALRSELMVLATGCHQDDRYNAFIRKYQPDLMGNEKAVGEVFKRMYGKRAQQEHDRFTTDLANGESSAGHESRHRLLRPQQHAVPEVMALRGASELPAYAAGKDLVPPTVDCVRRWRTRRRAQTGRRRREASLNYGVTVAVTRIIALPGISRTLNASAPV